MHTAAFADTPEVVCGRAVRPLASVRFPPGAYRTTIILWYSW